VDVTPTVRRYGKSPSPQAQRVLPPGGPSAGHNVPRSQALGDVPCMPSGNKREPVKG